MITPSAPIVSREVTPLSPERADLRKAAQAFEAIFVRQLLSAASASPFAKDTPFTGPGLEQFQTMQNEHFAEIAANSGAFGIARSIEQQLAAHVEGQASTPDQSKEG